MKNFKIYSRPFVVLSITVLLVMFPIISNSQTDTISSLYKIQYKKNLTELSELYCWSDTSFYPGNFKTNTVAEFQAEFQNLRLPFFTELENQTEDFYKFLIGLDIEEKQNLIRYFSYYEKEIEAVLESNGLPGQLKYLAPALSAMNPNAVSIERNAGIWQLTHFQIVLKGATINKLVDERFTVSVSTIAAAKQIKQDLKQFGTIDLAVTAFCLGNVKVRNALQRATDNEREVMAFLPDLAREHIAAFQATAVFLNANKFVASTKSFADKITPDTVNINRQLHFQQVSDVLGISTNELKYLNPQYKFQIIPGDKKTNKLILPDGRWDDFVVWQDSIYNSYDSTFFQLVTQKIEYPPSPNRQYVREPVKDLEIEGKTKIEYRLKTGDVLGIIAENYDVRVADLKYWNNIYNERKIQAGKKLDIFVDDDKADYYLSLAASQSVQKKTTRTAESNQKSSNRKISMDLSFAKKVEHIVKNGESPYLIAKKYDGVTPDDILEWNNIDDARKIQIGQKLIVYLK